MTAICVTGRCVHLSDWQLTIKLPDDDARISRYHIHLGRRTKIQCHLQSGIKVENVLQIHPHLQLAARKAKNILLPSDLKNVYLL
jgi:hypothetical protein